MQTPSKSAVLIGDSLRLHYQHHVACDLEGAVHVSGPAENCGSSSNVRANLAKWLGSALPSVVHLNCGLHDLRRSAGSSEPDVPLGLYEANLTAIFRHLSALGVSHVIWATLTPIDEVRHQAMRSTRRFERDVSSYNDAALDIAREFGAEVNDLNAVVLAGGKERLLSGDGVHLTVEGYQVVGAAAARSISACLRLQSPNTSIERTVKSARSALSPPAHVKR